MCLQVDLEIGRECPTCVRGALAGRDFSEGDIIARVPVNSSVRFQKTRGYAPEYAYEFLSRMHLDPEFNRTFGPVLAAMAPPEDVFTPEMFSDSHIKLLQSPELVSGAASIGRKWSFVSLWTGSMTEDCWPSACTGWLSGVSTR